MTVDLRVIGGLIRLQIVPCERRERANCEHQHRRQQQPFTVSTETAAIAGIGIGGVNLAGPADARPIIECILAQGVEARREFCRWSQAVRVQQMSAGFV